MKYSLPFGLTALTMTFGRSSAFGGTSETNTTTPDWPPEWLEKEPELMIIFILMAFAALIGIPICIGSACCALRDSVQKHCNSSHTAERQPLRSRPE